MLSPVTYYLSGSIYGVKCCFILSPIREIHLFGLDQGSPSFHDLQLLRQGIFTSREQARNNSPWLLLSKASHTDNITHSCKIYQRCQVKNLSLFQGEIANNKSVSLQTSKLSFIPLCSLPIWIACTESVPRPSPLLLAAIACRAHLSPELGSIAIQVQIHFWRTAESK